MKGAIIWCFLGEALGQMYQKTKLKNVDVLTLYQGRMTNGRRSAPVPQLQCKGGTAGCGAFIPEIVQCYNRGSDGLDIQWECKTDMDNEYRFGKISVSCEGYDYPDDPYILAGSCGLEYTIDRTNAGKQQGGNSYSENSYSYSNEKSDTDWMSVIVVCIVIFILVKIVTRNNDENDIPPAGTAPPPYNPEFIPPAGTAPPPAYGAHRQHASQGTWRPGFFSGFGAGWFGNNWWNRPAGYTRHRSTHSNQSAYNHGFTDGARNSSPKRSSSSSSSSGTRTASGFGGTTRR